MIEMEHDTHREEARSHPGPGGGRWGAVLTALVMFLAGIGIGWLFTSEGRIDVLEPDTQTVTSDTTPGTTAPPVDEDLDEEAAEVETAPLLDAPITDEPVADVAEALMPSVVQIELPFSGLGSGVVYAPDGRILTAAHVVQGADEVTVRLADGDRVPGVVLGADAGNDIAVVKVDRDNLPAAPLALDEPPRVGQMAVALGSPWGLDSTVTAGVVSAVDQAIPGPEGDIRSMLQTDAPINPGNSGGPLADRHGRVIGINVSIFSQTGANAGVGFAVPIDRAFTVAESILTGEPFSPGQLGVRLGDNESNLAGAVIATVEPGSPADGVGLQPGDRVIEVDGVPIADWLDLVAQIRAHQAGDTVEIVFVRGEQQMSVEATLQAQAD